MECEFYSKSYIVAFHLANRFRLIIFIILFRFVVQHEEMSCRITKSIFKKYNIELSDDVNENLIAPDLVSAFIMGDTEFLLKNLGPDHMFLSEVLQTEQIIDDRRFAFVWEFH